MKKLYTLLAMAAVAASATAATTLVSRLDAQSAAFKTQQGLEQTFVDREYAPDSVKTPPTGEWVALEGQGTACEGFLEDINSDTDVDPGTMWAITIEQSSDDPTWYRTIFYNENSPMMDITGEADTDYLYFNVADSARVYTTEFLIGGGTYRVWQCCVESGMFEYLSDASTLAASQKYGTLDENGVIRFPANSFWYLDSEAGYFYRINGAGAFGIVFPGTTLAPYWTDLGTATFYDGIMSPIFGNVDDNDTPLTYEQTVTVQVNRDNEYMFRLLNPWYGYFETEEPLSIDMSYMTEDSVRIGSVSQQSTGVVESTMGLCYVMSMSYGVVSSLDAFVQSQYYPAYNVGYDETTRKLTMPASSVLLYFPNYSTTSLYGGEQYQADSYVVIPEAAGIQNAVVEDNEDATPEYYNLQGVRIANPESGLYIVRTGSKVQKVYLR